MESLTSVCDENLSIPFDGVSGRSKKGASVRSKEGVGLGGRKALRDVSNSVHPTPIHSSKTKISFNDTFSSVLGIQDPSKKKGVSRVTKKAQTGARKALSDISNLDEPRLDEAPKKNPNAFTGEGFLHNHECCIQKRDMNVNEFLMSLGLDDDSTANNKPVKMDMNVNEFLMSLRLDDDSTANNKPVKMDMNVNEFLMSGRLDDDSTANNKPVKMKLFSPHTSLEMDEMAELFGDPTSPPRHESLKIESPLPSPKFFNHWMLDDQEFLSFKLAETPRLLKP